MEMMTMEFLLMQYCEEKKMMAMPREEAKHFHGAYMAYTAALKEAGVYVSNRGLKPIGSATTVRNTSVLDGPFAETKEQFAGFYLIDVEDLDAALAWAKRHPAAPYGAVEVRPVWGA
jgi:hypothetical protein